VKKIGTQTTLASYKCQIELLLSIQD